jgi:hypothetical protein
LSTEGQNKIRGGLAAPTTANKFCTGVGIGRKLLMNQALKMMDNGCHITSLSALNAVLGLEPSAIGVVDDSKLNGL